MEEEAMSKEAKPPLISHLLPSSLFFNIISSGHLHIISRHIIVTPSWLFHRSIISSGHHLVTSSRYYHHPSSSHHHLSILKMQAFSMMRDDAALRPSSISFIIQHSTSHRITKSPSYYHLLMMEQVPSMIISW